MENLQNGISNVPAILLSSPQISLQSIYLESYEVFLTKPLHDLKGHAQNLIDEVRIRKYLRLLLLSAVPKVQ